MIRKLNKLDRQTVLCVMVDRIAALRDLYEQTRKRFGDEHPETHRAEWRHDRAERELYEIRRSLLKLRDAMEETTSKLCDWLQVPSLGSSEALASLDAKIKEIIP